jgi:putative cardiolipin synthase
MGHDFELAPRQARDPIAHGVALAASLALAIFAGERLRYRRDEPLAAHGLLEEIHRAKLHRLDARLHVAMSGQEDHGQADAAFDHGTLQLGPLHPGHAHVQQHATLVIGADGAKERVRSLEYARAPARGIDEAREATREHGIVVDDVDRGGFGQRQTPGGGSDATAGPCPGGMALRGSWRMRAVSAMTALAAAAVACGCASLPPIGERADTRAFEDTAATALGRAVAPLADAHPGKTGVHAMPSGTDAFAARVSLARTAQRSIDAQYYIWHTDETGMILFEELANAARRGVRVRLLLDDQGSHGADDVLAALALDPNFEIRLYNPFAQRGVRLTEYLGDFWRVNRRMHNKAFIADNKAAIVGGRNVGNEYFGAGTATPFQDLDALIAGDAVAAVSAQFDRYWNSASAYPAAAVVAPAAGGAALALLTRFDETRAHPDSRTYVEAVRRTPLLAALQARSVELEWTDVRVLSDDPAKTLDRTGRRDLLLIDELATKGLRAQRNLDMVSPYFVPGEDGARALEDLARSGVRVRVLTNSFAATDVSVVHAGYAKRRCGLARAGVALYELKGTGKADAKRASGGRSGSSATSLHAKTYAADGERVFIGSFNFDMRSALLNTEMGLVIRSPALASRLARHFEEELRSDAYEVRPSQEGGCVVWIERSDGAELRHENEPGAGFLRRMWLGFLSLLPIDWML